MKILKKILKRIIYASFFLYLYNFIFYKQIFIIPINLINIAIVSATGIVGLIGLIIFKIFIL